MAAAKKTGSSKEKKKKKREKRVTAYRHFAEVNAGKTAALIALFPAFREALGGLQSLTRREVLGGLPLLKWRLMPEGSLDFTHRLSGRQMKSVQNMVYEAFASWQSNLENQVREFITYSELPELRKAVLYRVNARHCWWNTTLSLPWELDPATGELSYISEKDAEDNPAVVWLEVAAEDLTLARQMARRARKDCAFPDLRRVDTLKLDSIVAKTLVPKKATRAGQVGWWVKISTLTSGKPVEIPLSRNTYFDLQREATLAAGGRMCGAVQLHLVRDVHRQPTGVGVSLILENATADTRTTGQSVGVDFGVSSALFALSTGELLGTAMLARLRELDAILTPYAADLQRRGVSLKTDARYQSLQRRITSYVTNEIGRLLNQLAAREGEAAVMELVTEKLDFRGGGLSRRMNRILTRTGRKILQTRLTALTDKHGIAVTEVPSPWTSCECSGCGYTDKKNRRGKKFRCRFCGLTLHADVNAARVILSRRSRPTPEHRGSQSRKITFQLLDRRHRQRWKLPAEGTDPGIAGDLEQSA